MAELVTNVLDLRELARRRVPRAFFEYADRGSYDELTLRANRVALEALRLRQRVMVDVSKRNLATTMLGEPVALPLALAPVGLTGHSLGASPACGVKTGTAGMTSTKERTYEENTHSVERGGVAGRVRIAKQWHGRNK